MLARFKQGSSNKIEEKVIISVALSKSLTSLQLAKKIILFADDKKAQDIVMLDMRKLVNFCDFFVIATGTSSRHVKAIAEGVEDDLRALGLKANLGKGSKNLAVFNPNPEHGAWMLLDMGDVVVHVFEPDAREFYELEHLWQDAPVTTPKLKSSKKSKV